MRRTGFTLVELIVVIAVIGMMAAISGVAVATLKLPRESAEVAVLRSARAQAILTETSVRAVSNPAPRTPHVLFLPDGRAIGPGVDALTGAPR
jgi:prepilin-type N-terminal cleavage/methylation domain-containing protein